MIENYKGIMLCDRPQASINLEVNKPFVSRVTHQEPIGYNPCKQVQIHKPIKRIIIIIQATKPVLNRHREWLETFKSQQKNKQLPRQSPPQKNKLQQSQLQQSQLPQQQLDTKQQIENNPDELEDIDNEELDELLDFTKNLDFEKYINDLEIKTVMEALKKRIEELKESKELPPKHQRSQKSKSSKQPKKVTYQDFEEKEWDKSVQGGEQNKQSIIEQVSKKLAEELLRNNKYLRSIHSNISMQKLIEVEAKRQLQKQ